MRVIPSLSSSPNATARKKTGWKCGGIKCYNTRQVIYKYLYQDRENRNQEGEIRARSRDEAYTLLRRQGIRPYRIIGDDPWNWRPFAISVGYVILSTALVVLGVIALTQARELKELQNERAWLESE